MPFDVKEFSTKPCVIRGCPGTMIYSLRAVHLRENSKASLGWVCDTVT